MSAAPEPSAAAYDGPASLVTSGGDSFAECRLVAHAEPGGWEGELTDIMFRTQMVPVPLRSEERIRLDASPERPIVTVTVLGEEGPTARVRCDDPLPG